MDHIDVNALNTDTDTEPDELSSGTQPSEWAEPPSGVADQLSSENDPPGSGGPLVAFGISGATACAALHDDVAHGFTAESKPLHDGSGGTEHTQRWNTQGDSGSHWMTSITDRGGEVVSRTTFDTYLDEHDRRVQVEVESDGQGNTVSRSEMIISKTGDHHTKLENDDYTHKSGDRIDLTQHSSSDTWNTGTGSHNLRTDIETWTEKDGSVHRLERSTRTDTRGDGSSTSKVSETSKTWGADGKYAESKTYTTTDVGRNGTRSSATVGPVTVPRH
ncbi:hypothetical protein [Nocardia huaxiensis]|uniref:hypothetical protein n=1 Tax=Nocardia huaxiensis TaxID=2755382 RepID=UPI001E3419C9|nr:hypothetical protein [Nocardia huaxiensis]UFS97198.1 hypothetical protein LPY97_04515 [Nocardia huaxiensis]